MGFAAFSGITNGAWLTLILSVVFFICSLVPFILAHSDELRNGEYQSLLFSEDLFTPLTVIFLALSIFAFGFSRYELQLQTDDAKHLESVCSKYDSNTTWQIKGRITEEPVFKNGHLEVLVKPDIARPIDDISNNSIEIPTLEITNGLLLATVMDNDPSFGEVAFGQTVEVVGTLDEATEQRNPGSLNYKKYLNNRGIYRTIRIAPRKGILKVVKESEGGNPWYRFALYLKNEILKVIKQTVPYPQSSFLGGVLLGLKGGLPANVAQEFRMTGVSHVLAVSGLHVTIIAALLYGLFAMLKLPLKYFAPVIVFFLFTFALIVGWPSSAVRAALMNSMFILSRTYLKKLDFKASVLFALTVACDFILLLTPLQLTEPSFTLSVMAIYALAMFSEPSQAFLSGLLKGAGLYTAFACVIIFYFFLFINHQIVLQPYFFSITLTYFICASILCYKLAKKAPVGSICYEDIPQWLQSFLAAQMAILLAMMGPLSAYYFGQFSLASPIANIIAIPLIGVIVQVALIAGIIGAFVPVIGIYIAFVFNAANWLFIKIFMGMASMFAYMVPYPRVSQPDIYQLALYYLVLHLVFFHREIWTGLKQLLHYITEMWEDTEHRIAVMVGTGIAISAVAITMVFASADLKPMPEFRMTVLDVGFGSSTIIQESGRVTVIDCGLVENQGDNSRDESIVQPALSSMQATKIDSMVITSFLPEKISGFHSIVSNFRIEKLYVPFDIPTDGKAVPFTKFAKEFSFGDRKFERKLDEDEIKLPPCNYMELAWKSYNQLIKDIKKYNIPVKFYEAGDVLHDTAGRIEALYPKSLSTKYNQYYDGSILKISQKDVDYLYVAGNNLPLEKVVDFKPEYIIMADLPIHFKKLLKFADDRKPSGIVFSFRMPSYGLTDGYYLAKNIKNKANALLDELKDMTVPCCVTMESGAVEINQNRNNVTVRRYISKGSRQ